MQLGGLEKNEINYISLHIFSSGTELNTQVHGICPPENALSNASVLENITRLNRDHRRLLVTEHWKDENLLYSILLSIMKWY